jgi:hypothetical protein
MKKTAKKGKFKIILTVISLKELKTEMYTLTRKMPENVSQDFLLFAAFLICRIHLSLFFSFQVYKSQMIFDYVSYSQECRF